MSNNYELSDEEFAKLDLNDLEQEEENTPEEEEEETLEEQPEEEDEYEESEEADNESETEADNEEYLEEQETSEEEDDSVETDTNVEDNDDQEEVTPEEVDSENETQESDEKSNDEYKAFYEAITGSFRAAGKEVQISNPDDIKALMQQGISYSQKMAAMKPGLNILRTLDKHDLNDPDKISFLIDLHNRDPQAIAKLVKDSKIDLYEFDNDEESTYVPRNKIVEETKIESVVEDLKHLPSFSVLLDSVNGEWDEDSKKFVVDNPQVLKVLTAQVESGMFKKITDAIEYEQMLGRLKDVPYIEAYSIIESQMSQGSSPKQDKPKKTFKASRPKAKPTNNSNKRKVASPNSSSNKSEDTFNPLTVSDEELLQIMEQNSKY